MRIEEPRRVERTYEQHLKASPAALFPMLCPVLEKEWVEGWDPVAVYTRSGVAEDDCVFVTPGKDGAADAVWVVTRYEPASRIEFVKVVPDVTASRIRIALRDDGAGGTLANVTYQHTALSDAGAAVVDALTEEAYVVFMRAWEESLDRYLAAVPV